MKKPDTDKMSLRMSIYGWKQKIVSLRILSEE